MNEEGDMEHSTNPSDTANVGGATRRTLRRSRGRVIAGVCGGIAEWFGWSPTRVRWVYVIVSVLSAAFPGTLVYLLLWILMPGPDTE
jgi:phage shock protein PspC (stress-responsive transcriptional regulator)